MNMQKLNKNGDEDSIGGATIILTRGMGEPTYELLLSSHPGGVSVRLVWLVVGSPVLNIFFAGHSGWAHPKLKA